VAWLQRDPAGFVDGLNLYAYCRGDLVNQFDPWGLFLFGLIDGSSFTRLQDTISAGLSGVAPGPLATVAEYVGAAAVGIVEVVNRIDAIADPMRLAEGTVNTVNAGIDRENAAGSRLGYDPTIIDYTLSVAAELTGANMAASGFAGFDVLEGRELKGWERFEYAAQGVSQMIATGGFAASMSIWGVRSITAPKVGNTAIPANQQLSPVRMTQAGETFYHYGYIEHAPLFQNGLRPGSYATSIGTLTAMEAQAGLALPLGAPRNVVYTVSPPKGTIIIVNPSVRPSWGQPGGLPECIFPNGTPPGSVSPPSIIR